MLENIWIIQDKDGEVIRAYSSLDRANEDMDILEGVYKLIETPIYHGATPEAITPVGALRGAGKLNPDF